MTLRSDRRLVIGAGVWLTLGGCVGGRVTPPPPSAAASSAPIELQVADVAIEPGFPPVTDANFIDERRSAQLAAMTRDRLAATILPAGGAGIARVQLLELGIVERLRDERSGGIRGFVSGEPTYDLRGDLSVRVMIVDAVSGYEQAYADAAVGRTVTLPAGATVIERDNAANLLIARLLDQLDEALRASVRQHLGGYMLAG